MTREEWKNLRKERGMTLYTRKQKSSGWLEWELDGVFKSAAILRREKKEYGCDPDSCLAKPAFAPVKWFSQRNRQGI